MPPFQGGTFNRSAISPDLVGTSYRTLLYRGKIVCSRARNETSEYTVRYMDTLQKSSVLPVVGVIGLCVLGVVLIGVFGRGTASVSTNGVGSDLAIPVSAADHMLGDASAPVTIVEYADFQCPSCKAASPVLAKLVADEAGKVAVVYRYFTLSQHANAVPSARAAEAAALQGKFWDMHDVLFEKQSEWELLPDPTDTFVGYATTLGLDAAKFKADMQAEAVIARVTQDTTDAMKSRLNHTPTIFVNGVEMDGAPSYDALKATVDSATVAK
jgi:protein-disulfide isomerase